jgi:DNA-binding NtrC family response regulator
MRTHEMRSQSIVLVGDDDDRRNALGDALQQCGFEVIVFHEFKPARRYLELHSPRALVTDIRLGAFNGLHLVLLAREWTPQTTAFVYSAHDDRATREDAASCGAVYASLEEILSLLVPMLGAPDAAITIH